MREEDGRCRKKKQGSVGSGVLGRSASGSRLSAEAKSQLKHTYTSGVGLRREVSSGRACPSLTVFRASLARPLLPTAAGSASGPISPVSLGHLGTEGLEWLALSSPSSRERGPENPRSAY